jgi:hypothetical protein
VRPFGASRLATARDGKLLRHTLALLCEDEARLGRLGGRLLRESADVQDVLCWTVAAKAQAVPKRRRERYTD